MGRVFAVTVAVTNPDTRNVTVFRPGDTAPEWVLPFISNEEVWEASSLTPSSDEDGSADQGGSHGGEGDSTGDNSDGDPAPVDDTPATPVDVPIPPKAGPGASAEAWAAYAAAHGFAVDKDAKRDDIIESLKAEGINTGE